MSSKILTTPQEVKNETNDLTIIKNIIYVVDNMLPVAEHTLKEEEAKQSRNRYIIKHEYTAPDEYEPQQVRDNYKQTMIALKQHESKLRATWKECKTITKTIMAINLESLDITTLQNILCNLHTFYKTVTKLEAQSLNEMYLYFISDLTQDPTQYKPVNGDNICK